ncbi:sensor histidine kinase [Candidatus Formimonas warabiya]|uniref:histidine kinase n=1 Tax=Formimonas warabiya TaxID=1761012 RepID=A0A3G1KML2_FORW1|nr:HAMP domain-containing sensor histidine kinase [Candidatus Formimonas warabiya]ATW23701.1 hypothetical protein DCMF_01855 [Candidatus Formimonas warabiya]
MRQTIFKRLFLTYGITLIIGFGILALLLLQLFNQYFIETKKQLLMDQGKKIRQEIVLGLYTGQLDQKKLFDDLQILDKFLNARIWLVDSQGVIFGVSGPHEEKYLGKKIDGKQLLPLFQGKSIFEKGTFGGKLEEPSLTVGYPIFWKNLFKGGILIHASLPEVQKTFADIYRLTVWAILLSGLIAYGILYIQIRKISQPLKEISEAAKIIADGEFQKRLSIETGDEIEELGKSFNHMAESLEKIEENRRNLVANISHDLRTPMTSIRGFIEGIVDGTIPQEEHQHYLNVVLEESKRLIKMTNDLLELSNIQQGQVEVRKQAFELHETIRRKLISFEKLITEKNLGVTLILYADQVRVFADPLFVERILSNLLDNAVKFTPEKGNIVIRTSDDHERVRVEIENSGVNISDAEVKKIWERFHKGDSSRGKYKTGFGLGLAIVKEMVGRMEERIWAESGQGKLKVIFTVQKA